jgi:hypothetical protein
MRFQFRLDLSIQAGPGEQVRYTAKNRHPFPHA